MAPPTDAPFNQSLLNDVFDYSRYPNLKAKDLPFSTSPPNPSRSARQQAFFASFKELSPRKQSRCHPRNVSEPQLISSTNYMSESWYANFGSARTVGDITNLSIHDDISTPTKRSRSTVSGETLFSRLVATPNREPPPLPLRNAQDISKGVKSNDREDWDEGSLYSTDSADQEAHPFLLSMPVIPQIKLERKATVRKPEPGPALDDTQKSLLSPRVKNIKIPARDSSRRYGHIGPPAGANSQVVAGPLTSPDNSAPDAPQRTGWSQDRETDTPATLRRYSNSPEACDDEEQPLLKDEIVDSPHADVLLSLIDDAELSGGETESSLDETSPLIPIPPKHSQRSHRRSTATTHSLSFSNLVHAVADGYASLDTILRKPKPTPTPKPKPILKPILIPAQNRHAAQLTPKWAPKNGQIIIKVFVPSTDDIWAFCVPEDITLADFTSRVVSKLGFAVSFSGSLWDEPRYHFRTDERFRAWVKKRVRFGRNLPLVAHVVNVAPKLPLVKLSVVGADGCEVWCYA